MELDVAYQCCVESIHETLKLHGYKKLRTKFSKSKEDVLSIIQFQKDKRSPSNVCRFTINLAIVVECLHPEWRGHLTRADAFDGNLQIRLGRLMPEPDDVWWEITEETDIELLKKELTELINNLAIPYLEKYSNKVNLIQLWESGESPGITDFQRKDFLTEIRKP